MDAFLRMGDSQTTTIAEPMQEISQPPLEGVADNSAVLQRLSELESVVKSGFDRITSKLANTVISTPASIPAVAPPIMPSRFSAIKTGGRRKTKRSKRMRSK